MEHRIKNDNDAMLVVLAYSSNSWTVSSVLELKIHW